MALEKFLRDRRNEEMVEKLNRVYAGGPDPEDRRIVPGFKIETPLGLEGSVVNEIRRGDVYRVDFGPSSRPEPEGGRPCVVVQNDLLNRSRIATTVVCAITST
jgi:PemK-like, MazF-like toxin of type II toxin-antitoxin system